MRRLGCRIDVANDPVRLNHWGVVVELQEVRYRPRVQKVKDLTGSEDFSSNSLGDASASSSSESAEEIQDNNFVIMIQDGSKERQEEGSLQLKLEHVSKK